MQEISCIHTRKIHVRIHFVCISSEIFVLLDYEACRTNTKRMWLLMFVKKTLIYTKTSKLWSLFFRQISRILSNKKRLLNIWLKKIWFYSKAFGYVTTRSMRSNCFNAEHGWFRNLLSRFPMCFFWKIFQLQLLRFTLFSCFFHSVRCFEFIHVFG